MPRPHFTRDAWGDALRALLEPTDGRKKPKSAKQRYWMLLGAAAEARGFACVVADDGTLGFVQPTDGDVRPSDAWVRLPGADHSSRGLFLRPIAFRLGLSWYRVRRSCRQQRPQGVDRFRRPLGISRLRP